MREIFTFKTSCQIDNNFYFWKASIIEFKRSDNTNEFDTFLCMHALFRLVWRVRFVAFFRNMFWMEEVGVVNIKLELP